MAKTTTLSYHLGASVSTTNFLCMEGFLHQRLTLAHLGRQRTQYAALDSEAYHCELASRVLQDAEDGIAVGNTRKQTQQPLLVPHVVSRTSGHFQLPANKLLCLLSRCWRYLPLAHNRKASPKARKVTKARAKAKAKEARHSLRIRPPHRVSGTCRRETNSDGQFENTSRRTHVGNFSPTSARCKLRSQTCVRGMLQRKCTLRLMRLHGV